MPFYIQQQQMASHPHRKSFKIRSFCFSKPDLSNISNAMGLAMNTKCKGCVMGYFNCCAATTGQKFWPLERFRREWLVQNVGLFFATAASTGIFSINSHAAFSCMHAGISRDIGISVVSASVSKRRPHFNDVSAVKREHV